MTQRSNQSYLPGLTAKPWWSPEEFPWISMLENATESILSEARALEQQGFLRPRILREIPPEERKGDLSLIESEEGGWELFRLHYRDRWFSSNTQRCPKTTQIVARIPGITGTVAFGVLLPHTRVRAHCGLSNTKLRVHLGLHIPPECGLRVAERSTRWSYGRCLIFDDTFEHEVWNDSNEARWILCLDVFHPELSAAQQAQQLVIPPERYEAFEEASRWKQR